MHLQAAARQDCQLRAKPRRGKGRSAPAGFRGRVALGHLAFGLLASKTVREVAVSSHVVCGALLGQL